MHPTRCDALERLEPRHLLATISWDGGGGDNLWHNPLNWDGDALPGPADTALIDLPGSDPLIKYTGGFTRIAELRSRENLRMWGGELLVTDLGRNHGSLTISGGTLRIRGPWKQLGEFRMTGGALRGAGDFIPVGGGEWSGGRTTGSGRFQLIASGLGLTISGDVMIGRRFVVDAPFTWTHGTVTFVHAGRFHILHGRTLTMNGAHAFTGFGGVFNNGRIVADGGRVQSWLFSAGPGASIEIGAGGWTLASGVIRSPFLVAQGATVQFAHPTSWATLKFQDGASFTATGGWEIGNTLVEVWVPGLRLSTLRIDGLNEDYGLHLMTDIDAAADSITVSRGRLDMSAGATITVYRTLSLEGGSLGGAYWSSGRLIIASTASMTVTGGSGNGPHIENHGRILFDTSSDLGPFDFDNHAVVTKRGSGTLYAGYLTGAIALQEGRINVFGPRPCTATMTVAAGATVTLSWRARLAPTGSIIGPGRVNIGATTPLVSPALPLVIEGEIDAGTVFIMERTELRAPALRAAVLTYMWTGGLTALPSSQVVVTNAMSSGGYGTELRIDASSHATVRVTNSASLYGPLTARFAAPPIPGDVFDLVFFGTMPLLPSSMTALGLDPALNATFEILTDRIRLRISG